MSRKEVLAVIGANPGKALFCRHGKVQLGEGQWFGLFEPISKTRLLRAAKALGGYVVDTYNNLRPDLADRYRNANGDNPIVCFYEAGLESNEVFIGDKN